jgi:hypothetical protein
MQFCTGCAQPPPPPSIMHHPAPPSSPKNQRTPQARGLCATSELRWRWRAVPPPPPPLTTTPHFRIEDCSCAGTAQEKQHDLERRIDVIEKSIGISKSKSKVNTRPTSANTRLKIAILTRQLSLARAAIQAMIKSEQDGVVSAAHLTAHDIKLR